MQISFKSPFKGKVLLNSRLEVLCVPGLMSCLPSALVSLPNVTDTNAPLPISISNTIATEYYKNNSVRKNSNVMTKNGAPDRNPIGNNPISYQKHSSC